jgi:DNA-binding CsgD family transcriptional regulator
MIFMPDDLRFILAAVLLAGILLPIVNSLSAIFLHIGMSKLSPIRTFSLGRLTLFVGLLIGEPIGYVGFSEGLSGQLGSLAVALPVALFLLLAIVSASFIMTEDNYPYPDHRAATGALMDGIGLGQSGEARNAFRVRCAVVADTYNLSPRQREVMFLLAKGRSADYISEKLVISFHTTNAHVYNIYQKIGIHSRRELMDLVESVGKAEDAGNTKS